MKTHGHASRKNKRSSTYMVWENMIQRCTNENDPKYKDYGGRGVLIDPDWFDFSNFLKDMGEKPKGKSLDRIDNDGDYCKENCRWATVREQNNNNRKNHFITFKGKTQTCIQWSRELGVSYNVVSNRINNLGWSEEKALTTPVKRVREDL